MFQVFMFPAKSSENDFLDSLCTAEQKMTSFLDKVYKPSRSTMMRLVGRKHSCCDMEEPSMSDSVTDSTEICFHANPQFCH